MHSSGYQQTLGSISLNPSIRALALVWIFLLLISTVASAHFALARKIEISPLDFEQPASLLLRIEGSEASRADYADYLQRLTAFDTKYERMQHGFYVHFNLVRGISLFHPDNVHKYIDHVATVKSNPQLHRAIVQSWFEEQAEMFARFEHYRAKAEAVGLATDQELRAVIDLYAAGAKTEFLEELIVLGTMEPTLAGLVAFVSSLPEDKRRAIATGIENDTELTPPNEQRHMQRRWITFRRDVIAHADVENRCKGIASADVSPNTVILSVNGHTLTMADYLAIFGRGNERAFKNRMHVNCNQMVLFFALADVADNLGIIPERVEKKIEVSRRLLLTAKQIVQELGPKLNTSKPSSSDVAYVRDLQAYPEVVQVKDLLLEATQKSLTDNEALFLDRDFLRTVPWRLERSLAPKHSIHF